jgi:hypothetical protein
MAESAAVRQVVGGDIPVRTSLLQSNPYLRDPDMRKAALRVSAATSSAVEGIRKPFMKASPAKVAKPARLSKRASSAK